MSISGDISIHVLGFSVTYYGLFILLGVAAGTLLAWFQARLHHVSFDDVILLICTCGALALLGAKLLYVIVSLGTIDASRLGDPTYLASLLQGGFVFYGGLLGALAGLPLSARLFHVDARRLADLLAPCLALGHGIGRLGCLMVGCCYGMPWSGPLAVTYDHSIAAPNGVALLPVQLIETVGELVLCALLLVRTSRRPQGSHAAALYLAGYAVLRFSLEFVRFDDAERGFALGLSTSQWISLALLGAVGAWALVGRRRARAASGR